MSEGAPHPFNLFSRVNLRGQFCSRSGRIVGEQGPSFRFHVSLLFQGALFTLAQRKPGRTSAICGTHMSSFRFLAPKESRKETVCWAPFWPRFPMSPLNVIMSKGHLPELATKKAVFKIIVKQGNRIFLGPNGCFFRVIFVGVGWPPGSLHLGASGRQNRSFSWLFTVNNNL